MSSDLSAEIAVKERRLRACRRAAAALLDLLDAIPEDADWSAAASWAMELHIELLERREILRAELLQLLNRDLQRWSIPAAS